MALSDWNRKEEIENNSDYQLFWESQRTEKNTLRVYKRENTGSWEINISVLQNKGYQNMVLDANFRAHLTYYRISSFYSLNEAQKCAEKILKKSKDPRTIQSILMHIKSGLRGFESRNVEEINKPYYHLDRDRRFL